MTPIADLVERMFADGASPTAIVLAIRAVEDAALRVTLASRDASRTVTVNNPSPAAVRARRYRQNLKKNQGGAKANDVAQPGAEPRDGGRDASRDERNASLLLPCNKEGSIGEGLKEEKKQESKRTESVRARSTRMQLGAPLTEQFRTAALELGASPDVIADMWVEHVDYWVGVPGQRGVKTEPNGWLATWRNDVRRKLKLGAYNGQRSHGNRTNPGARESGTDAVLAGVARAVQRRARERQSAGSGDGSAPEGGHPAGEDDPRLI